LNGTKALGVTKRKRGVCVWEAEILPLSLWHELSLLNDILGGDTPNYLVLALTYFLMFADRLAFASENLADLRSKLKVHIVLINDFILSLSAGSLARIEGVLDELVKDIKSGKKEPTVISTHEEDDLAWSEVERELVGEGITIDDVNRYKNEIRVYLKGLIGENLGIDVDSSSSLVSTGVTVDITFNPIGRSWL
jgi:hypothetical protein